MLKAFTLIEMLIVIVIIGILGSMTMNFSRDSIDEASARNEKEAFLHRYNSKLSQNLTTKRYNQKEYSGMTINLQSGDNFLTNIIYFKNTTGSNFENSGNFVEKYNFNKLIILGNEYENIDINIKPYTFDCDIDFGDDEQKSLTGIFKLKFPQSSVLYCFNIQQYTCKLQEIGCEGLGSK